jgi:hypothetical protein
MEMGKRAFIFILIKGGHGPAIPAGIRGKHQPRAFKQAGELSAPAGLLGERGTVSPADD